MKSDPDGRNAVRLTRQPSFSLLTAVSREQGKRAKNSLETKSWPIRLANVATFQRILNRWDWWNRRDGNNEWRVTCIGTEQSFETTWNIVSQYRVDFSGKTGNAGKINFTFYYTATRSRCKNNLSRMESRARARLFSIVVSSSNEPELYRKEQALISDPDLEQRYMNLFRYDIENRRSISRRVLYKFDRVEDVFSFSWQSFNDKRAESIDRYFRIERAVSRWKDRLSSYLVLEEHLRKRNQIVYESETLHNVESSFEDIFW